MDISGVSFILPPYHAPPVEIVGAEFDSHFVASTEDDPVSAHVSAGVGVNFVSLVVLQVASERPAFEYLFDDGALIDSHGSLPV